MEWFTQHACSVRVMLFLDGLPRSTRGFVTRDGVPDLEPAPDLYS